MARILVVDDNQPSRDLVAYLIRAAGHTPLTARDGAEGVELAQQETPDLILMDLQMPKLDGFEAVRRIKDDPTLRAISVVAVTAQAMVGDRERVLAAGFDGYLSKPITPESFRLEAEGFLSAPHLQARQAPRR